MWEQDGVAFFFGPIFIHPEETEHEPTKMFYQREVFLSNQEETSPMMCILGTNFLLLHHLLCPVLFFPFLFIIILYHLFVGFFCMN